MSILSDYVERMVDGGMEMAEAMQIAAELFAAGVASASSGPSSGALRTRKWRHKASQNVTSDAPNPHNQNVTKRHIPSQSVTSDIVPISISNNSKNRERQNRGSRIAADWSPSDAEKVFAQQEGYSEFEVRREINKFRDYWTACAGAKGVKLDWSATWRQWVRNGAERAGKTPAPSPADKPASGFYAKAGSEQLQAWDAHRIREMGKPYPRDKNQGWHFKTEWPPDYVPQEGLAKLSFDLNRGLGP